MLNSAKLSCNMFCTSHTDSTDHTDHLDRTDYKYHWNRRDHANRTDRKSQTKKALLVTVEEVTRTAQITRITWIADRRDHANRTDGKCHTRSIVNDCGGDHTDHTDHTDRTDQRDCRGPAEVLILSADLLKSNHPRMKGRQLPVN